MIAASRPLGWLFIVRWVTISPLNSMSRGLCVRSKVGGQVVLCLIARLVLWSFPVQSHSSYTFELSLPDILSEFRFGWVELKLDQGHLLQHPS
jgi:hypothetical protein